MCIATSLCLLFAQLNHKLPSFFMLARILPFLLKFLEAAPLSTSLLPVPFEVHQRKFCPLFP